MPRTKKQRQEVVEQPKRGRGRPSMLDAQTLRRVQRLSLLGVTDVEMADVLGISLSTLYNWQRTSPEFLHAQKRGKALADSQVAGRMYRDALNGNTTAQIFWLKNRRRGEWRDVQSREISGPNGGPIQAAIGTVIIDVAAMSPKQRDQFKGILLAAKAKEVQGESDGSE